VRRCAAHPANERPLVVVPPANDPLGGAIIGGGDHRAVVGAIPPPDDPPGGARERAWNPMRRHGVDGVHCPHR
jgi:hypothetical protein